MQEKECLFFITPFSIFAITPFSIFAITSYFPKLFEWRVKEGESGIIIH